MIIIIFQLFIYSDKNWKGMYKYEYLSYSAREGESMGDYPLFFEIS